MVGRVGTVAMAVVLGLSGLVNAQESAAARPGKRAPLERSWEITLARSAAPPEVTARATILVLEDTGYVSAVAGSSGVTCLVSRSQPQSIEPQCFDAEGSRTILQMELRRAALGQQGKSRDEIDRDIASGLLDGRFRLPERPAVSYMMSAAQNLFNDEGRHVGRWQPHLMIYFPYLTAEAIGHTGPDVRTAVVVDAGKPTANLMVIVREFIEPGATAVRP
jgi:hypothetical protein